MILFSDFDGTLRSTVDQLVLANNSCAVRHWRARTHQFVIVTGRNHGTIHRILPDWQELVDYIILDNGGAIFSNQDQLIYTCALSCDLLQQIQNLVADAGTLVFYNPKSCAMTPVSDDNIIKIRLYLRTAEQFSQCETLLSDQNWPIQILPWPKPGFSLLPNGTDPQDFYGFLDLVPKDGGKEYAIQYLLNTVYGGIYANREILTVGDDYNDINMISQYHGFCVKNSPPEVVKAAAGRIVSNVSELIYCHL